MISNLRKDNTIIIPPADKGNSTVVMDKKEYADKMHDMLSDENYCPQKKVPTLKLERLINTAFKELEKTRKRDPKLWKMITPQNSYPQLYYGLLKIYKPHVPLHPIVSSTGSATSLSRQGAHMLPHTTQRQDGLLHQNSSHFVEKIGRKVPQYSNVMVSFDVKRLFTIVLIQEALEVIEKRLVEDDTLDDRTLMIPATICHLTEL